MLPSRLRPYLVVSRFVATAAVRLWAYQLVIRVRGPRPEWAVTAMQKWFRGAWRQLRLDVQVVGDVPALPAVYLANHRSYLDIAVLSGVLGATFLSRADVAGWPVFGGVAQAVGCVFVDRDAPRDRVRAARELMRRVKTMSVVVFPEGTTGGAVVPGPFVPGVFRLLRRLEAPVIPVTVRYSDRRAYWVEDVTLWNHLRTQVLAGAGFTCTVHIGTPLVIPPGAGDEALAAAAQRAIAEPIETFGELCGAGVGA